MGTVLTTIMLSESAREWLTQQIDAGIYKSESELIQELIRQERARAAHIEAIRAALIEGDESGDAEEFDLESFKRQMMTDSGL